MLSKLVALASFGFAIASVADEQRAALAVDDECMGDTECSLNALQKRSEALTEEDDERTDDLLNPLAAVQYRDDYADEDANSFGWRVGGDKVWGAGAGIENVNGGNVGYYNSGMSAARAHCGGPGCALIVNPPNARSINHFHIHFVHYGGYGASLKKRMESKVCGHGGWHGGGLPCGGKAKFFPGFPGVFSAAMSGGSIHHASVIAWPMSCGGGGTIVQIAHGCSIEHQIRGDYNPHHHR